MRCFEPEGTDQCNGNGVCEGGVGFQAITCRCNDGFTGKNCETRISKCTGVTCFNGGTCLESNSLLSGYYCACNKNFTGTFCETS